MLKENVLLLTGNETHVVVLMSFNISKLFLDEVLNQNDPNKEEIIVYCILTSAFLDAVKKRNVKQNQCFSSADVICGRSLYYRLDFLKL